jgi:general secretion pathway protein M
MNLPTGATGRLLALALLLLPLALLVRFAFMPAWQAYQDQGEQIARASAQLQDYQRLAGQLPALREQLAALREQQVLTPYLIDAPNSALAAAGVQQRLQTLADAHGGRVLSTRVMRGSPDGPFERVAVSARLQVSLEGLQSMLYELETGEPYLFVDDLSVMSRPVRRGRQTVAGGSGPLETRLTLYGLRRAEGGGAVVAR